MVGMDFKYKGFTASELYCRNSRLVYGWTSTTSIVLQSVEAERSER